MTDKQKAAGADEIEEEVPTDVEADAEEEEDPDLFFTNARVVRLIREENQGKIIKRRVKVEMNKLLEHIGRIIAKEMAKKPYSTITYGDFLDAARPYLELAKINQERRRVIATLNKMVEDAKSLAMDLEEKTQETDFYFLGSKED
ncbi:hypothetical protein COT72_05070 [archaeon CG10_big_fil_rev_8_21_14_0_10_43_11]|nr:MAG: hypothetical protein COT72_05070 [archaeon CG10_big_fil_rev_8_21_14_0_10_43_11]